MEIIITFSLWVILFIIISKNGSHELALTLSAGFLLTSGAMVFFNAANSHDGSWTSYMLKIVNWSIAALVSSSFIYIVCIYFPEQANKNKPAKKSSLEHD